MLTLLLPPKTKQSGDDCVCCGLLSSQVACRLRAARRRTRGSTNASPATAPECATPHPLIFTWEVGSASAHNAGKYLPPCGLPLSPAVWFEPVPERRGSTGGSWLDPYGALRSLQGDPGAPWLLTIACQSCRAAARGCATLRKVKCGPKQCARVSATISLQGPEKNEQLWLPRGRSPLPHKGSLEVGRSQFCWCGCERRGGSSQPPPRNSFLPWIFPDHNRRVCSHFLLVSQLIFPLPAVICRWFLGHEHWPWAETHRKLGMASRHLCHQWQIPLSF